MPPVDVSKIPASQQAVKYNRRDLILYAIGIGCDELQFVYELDKNFAAFPTYPLVLPFRGTSFDVIDFLGSSRSGNSRIPGVNLDPAKVLDGDRYVEIINPLPLEGEFTVTSKVTGVYDVGKAAILENEAIMTDAAGKQYAKIVSQAFYRDAGGFGGPRPPKPSLDATKPDRAPDMVVSAKTSPTQAQIYRLSGDYNPLHVDPGFSKKVGFPVPILHGLCSYGHAAHSVLKGAGGNDPSRFVSIRGRFTAPVLPGETLDTEIWKVREDGDKEIFAYQTKIKERNIVAIGGGVVVLRKQGAAKL
ncbi:HotDog domain-containing protein [Hyaloraphidium curvatum]|nr:HotDog domain-containing protein [Hyaloraphidium curvatum]